MPCVSIGARSVANCLAQLHGVRLAELRLDRIAPAELTPRNIARLFAGPCQCIATCRPGALGEARRQKILLAAIAAGASYIDIEVDADDVYKGTLLRAARNSTSGAPGAGVSDSGPRGDLAFLQRADPAARIADHGANTRAAMAGRSHSAAGVAGGGREEQRLFIVARQEIIEQAHQDLRGEVLEAERWPVKEFARVCALAQAMQGRGEIVGLADDAIQDLRCDIVRKPDGGDGAGEIGKRRQGTPPRDRRGIDHGNPLRLIEPAVGRQAGEERGLQVDRRLSCDVAGAVESHIK